ncbi:hypothetical protein ACX3PU_00630 [Chryseobacterium sp. A301]
MNNFNLEELERKEIYQVSDSFFKEVQDKVLQNTIELEVSKKKSLPTKGKVIPLSFNWSYAAAALMVLLGLGVILKLNLNPQEEKLQTLVTTNSTSEVSSTDVKDPSSITLGTDTQSIAQVEESTLGSQSTELSRGEELRTAVPQRSSTRPTVVSKTVRSAAIDQVAMEQIITSLSSADLAELSRDAEMDVYLDLY